jgi:hypothetical protein
MRGQCPGAAETGNLEMRLSHGSVNAGSLN